MKEQLHSIGAAADNRFFTGEKTIVEEFASRIVACWHETTAGILELARACADADKQLAGPAKKSLIANLPFDRATFCRLVRIGNDPGLRPLRRGYRRVFLRCTNC